MGKFPISILDENSDVYHGGKPATITTVLKCCFFISQTTNTAMVISARQKDLFDTCHREQFTLIFSIDRLFEDSSLRQSCNWSEKK
jgi:hypothetical protein